MQSFEETAKAAAVALEREDAAEALCYFEELQQQCPDPSYRYTLLAQAGWHRTLDELANKMVWLAFGDAKKINRLFALFVRIEGATRAKQRLLKTFTLFASGGDVNAQRLYKVACYHIDFGEVAEAFQNAWVFVHVPKKFGKRAEACNSIFQHLFDTAPNPLMDSRTGLTVID